MTCKEKLKEMHPEWDENVINGQTMSYCPFELGIDYPPKQACSHTTCKHCWNHEVPGDNVEEVHAVDIKIEHVKKASEAFDDLSKTAADANITIKDSGDRTQFETGAVRDMREGKGRCDLMPLEVVANYVCESNDDTDWVLWSINQFQKSNSTSHLYSALSAFGENYYDHPSTMFLEVAKHFEEGAKKYGEANWQKGIPVYCYIDSAVRHYLKWLREDKDEHHDRAFCWNIMCCIWEVNYHNKEN